MRWLRLRPYERHSLVLTIAGLAYIGVGATYVTTSATPSRDAALHLALVVAPLPAWGCVWIVVGLLALASTRWPPSSITWGYTVLTVLSSVWAGTYALGVLAIGSPDQSTSGALIWGLISFLWWAIAGLTNPPRRDVGVIE